MLEIAICDNKKEDVLNYKNNLIDAIIKDNLDAEILKVTANPDELLRAVEGNGRLLFILLEFLYAQGTSGAELAKRIRKKDRESYIVFASKHTELIHTAFEGLIRPAGFLNKPVKRKELISVFLTAYCDHINLLKAEGYFSVTIGARFYRIPTRNILYFEAAQKKYF
ncbi:MAG: hypothetical protein A4E55_00293 [Pelotomaculum sp. PtaU1.Bin035]|nr:MAG: hypothetical protein A4E55_00293 [Pelotomaculum sp. PtaU1.Bin035]